MADTNNKRKVTVVFQTGASMAEALELQSALNNYVRQVTKGNADKEHELLSGVIRRAGVVISKVGTE